MKLVKHYLHISKDTAWDKARELGLTDEQAHKLISALYEVEFIVDVDTGGILSVNRQCLDFRYTIDDAGCIQGFEVPE